MTNQFSTYLLDEILLKEKIKKENLRRQLIEKVLSTLTKLSDKVSFKEAYLFGSIVNPDSFSEESDVDIGFVDLSDRDFFKTMAFISREIGIDVDVVQLEGHRLEEKIKDKGIRWIKKV
ncbi:MAG: nucleotidyltransferase domain-containing protein [bacterium]